MLKIIAISLTTTITTITTITSLTMTGAALAQAAWPAAKPVSIIVPFSAGGSLDATTRLVAQSLSLRLGQSVVVDNATGAGGVVGISKAIAAAPDGYSLIMAGDSPFASPVIAGKSPYRFDVLNELGHGLHEKIYENALVVEFKLRGIPFEQQKRFPVHYKTVLVGEFVPDLIVFGSIIVDTKTIDRITEHELGKMTNYLRVAKLRVGLILNFKHARLEWERRVV